MDKQISSQVDDNVIVIDVNLSRRMLMMFPILLFAGALLISSKWTLKAAADSSPEAAAYVSGMRRFYLTQDVFEGHEPKGTDGYGAGVCEDGYHFASFWEISDLSNLMYNTDLGQTSNDSGKGPPTAFYGWVRTGYSSGGSSIPGSGNCNNWTTNSTSFHGTSATLDNSWDATGPFPGWNLSASPDLCGNLYRVWCVED